MKISISVTKEEMSAAKGINSAMVSLGTFGSETALAALAIADQPGRYLLTINSVYTATFISGKEGAVIEYDISEEAAAKFYKFQKDNLLDIKGLLAGLNKIGSWISENKRKLKIVDKILFGGTLKDIALKISKLKDAWNRS